MLKKFGTRTWDWACAKFPWLPNTSRETKFFFWAWNVSSWITVAQVMFLQSIWPFIVSLLPASLVSAVKTIAMNITAVFVAFVAILTP